MTIRWRTTEEGAQRAEAALDIGGTVYLSVEYMGNTGWDWLVWDARCRALPRHGLAMTEDAAKRQAERSLREVSAVLLEMLGQARQVHRFERTYARNMVVKTRRRETTESRRNMTPWLG